MYNRPSMMIHRDPGCLVGYRYEHPVGDLRALTHCGEVYCSHDHNVPLHAHQGFEFMYVVSGTAYWQVGRTVHAQGPGELFWTVPGEFHKTARNAHQGYHKLWFGIRLWDLGQDGQEVARALQRMTETGRRIIPAAREMEAVIRGFILQVIFQRPGCAKVCRGYLRTFVSLLAQAVEEEGSSGRSIDTRPVSYPVQRAMAYMIHHLHGTVRLEDVAAAANLSVSQLCLYFRKTVGLTPMAYHRKLRLDAARDELLLPDITVTQVAMDFGFSSSQHFAMDFRKEFGTTPQAWKRGEQPVFAASS
jgi:AraC-like DNA-binding protein